MANGMTIAARASALLVTLGGCCGPVRGLYPPPDTAVRDIYVVNNHWHTGLVLRASELTPTLRGMLPRFANAEYLEIGWGDDRFYRSPQSTSGLAVQALFASRGSVLHVVPLSRLPEVHYREFLVDLYRLRISPEGHRRLVAFMETSFDLSDSGAAIELEPGWAPGSWFYRAHGKYSVLHTCNQWTADALRTTGFPISAFYASTADNIGWQIRTFGSTYQSDLAILRDGEPVSVAARHEKD
jgi:uncharacterized protein (TIGR02117 family)